MPKRKSKPPTKPTAGKVAKAEKPEEKKSNIKILGPHTGKTEIDPAHSRWSGYFSSEHHNLFGGNSAAGEESDEEQSPEEEEEQEETDMHAPSSSSSTISSSTTTSRLLSERAINSKPDAEENENSERETTHHQQNRKREAKEKKHSQRFYSWADRVKKRLFAGIIAFKRNPSNNSAIDEWEAFAKEANEEQRLYVAKAKIQADKSSKKMSIFAHAITDGHMKLARKIWGDLTPKQQRILEKQTDAKLIATFNDYIAQNSQAESKHLPISSSSSTTTSHPPSKKASSSEYDVENEKQEQEKDTAHKGKINSHQKRAKNSQIFYDLVRRVKKKLMASIIAFKRNPSNNSAIDEWEAFAKRVSQEQRLHLAISKTQMDKSSKKMSIFAHAITYEHMKLAHKMWDDLTPPQQDTLAEQTDVALMKIFNAHIAKNPQAESSSSTSHQPSEDKASHPKSTSSLNSDSTNVRNILKVLKKNDAKEYQTMIGSIEEDEFFDWMSTDITFGQGENEITLFSHIAQHNCPEIVSATLEKFGPAQRSILVAQEVEALFKNKSQIAITQALDLLITEDVETLIDGVDPDSPAYLFLSGYIETRRSDKQELQLSSSITTDHRLSGPASNAESDREEGNEEEDESAEEEAKHHQQHGRRKREEEDEEERESSDEQERITPKVHKTDGATGPHSSTGERQQYRKGFGPTQRTLAPLTSPQPSSLPVSSFGSGFFSHKPPSPNSIASASSAALLPDTMTSSSSSSSFFNTGKDPEQTVAKKPQPASVNSTATGSFSSSSKGNKPS